jgi:hypothetical protein
VRTLVHEICVVLGSCIALVSLAVLSRSHVPPDPKQRPYASETQAQWEWMPEGHYWRFESSADQGQDIRAELSPSAQCVNVSTVHPLASRSLLTRSLASISNAS